MSSELREASEIGYSAQSITISDPFDQISKVSLKVGNGDSNIESGGENGRTFEAECPFATEDIARDLANKFSGVSYQPYTAGTAQVDPSLELGDSVSIGGIDSAIYNQKTTFDDMMSSDISAPGENEIDHEYEYKSKIELDNERVASSVGGSGGVQEQIEEIKTYINQELVIRLDSAEAGMSSVINLKEYKGKSGTIYKIDKITKDKDGTMHYWKADGSEVPATEFGDDGTLSFYGGESFNETYAKIDDVKSSLENYVQVDGDKKTASAIMKAAVGDAVATFEAKVVSVNGISKSYAQILADVTRISGKLDVSGDIIQMYGGIHTRQDVQSEIGILKVNTLKLGNNSIQIYNDTYGPEEITSYNPTTQQLNAVSVIGC